MYFGGLGSYGFLDPDEGRYAEIAREMLESGDFVTPHLNYVKYFEKPPLFYWLTAAAMAAFGQREAVARCVPACCGLLTLLCTIFLGWRMFGPRVGLIGGWVYLTSLLPLILNRYLIIDALLCLCLTAAWAAWWLAFVSTAEHIRRRWLATAWLFLALAVLAKGPVAVVLSALLLAAFAAVRKDASVLWRTFTIPGVLIFAAAVTPWFVMVSLRNPEFLRYFIVVQHIERFAGREHAKPFWFFVPILVAGMGSWSLIFAAACAQALRTMRSAPVAVPATTSAAASPVPDPPAAERYHDKAVAFLVLWVVVVVGFFSISKCKLAPYILPAFPAAALLVAWFLSDLLDGGHVPGARAAALVTALLILVVTPLMPHMAASQHAVPYTDLAPLVSALQIAMAIGGLALLAAAARPRWLPLVGGALVVMFTPIAIQTTATVAKYKRIAALIKAMPELPPDVLVAEWKTYEQSLGFYTRRRVILVDYRGELRFGSTIGDQYDYFLSGIDSLRELSARGPLLLVVDPRRWPDVRALGLFRIIAANTSNAMLANAALIELLGLQPYPDDALPDGPCFMGPRAHDGGRARTQLAFGMTGETR